LAKKKKRGKKKKKTEKDGESENDIGSPKRCGIELLITQ
jgi:hypothetical protein